MTAAAIKAALTARKHEQAAGPRNVRELAQATGIPWKTLAKAVERDAFAPGMAEKIRAALPDLAPPKESP